MKVNLFELYDTASCLEEQGLKPQSPDHGVQSRGLRRAQALSRQPIIGSKNPFIDLIFCHNIGKSRLYMDVPNSLPAAGEIGLEAQGVVLYRGRHLIHQLPTQGSTGLYFAVRRVDIRHGSNRLGVLLS